jgi:hypothetical protein
MAMSLRGGPAPAMLIQGSRVAVVGVSLDLLILMLSIVSCLVHALNEALGPHIGPILVNEVEAGGAGVRFESDGPSSGDGHKPWPKRMLSFVIDEHMIRPVFVFEWILHV